MSDRAPTNTRRRLKRVLIGAGVLALIMAVLTGGWVYWWVSAHSTAGLEGTWRASDDPKHVYEFGSDGELACWYGAKEWWNKLGSFARWRRDGNRIIIRTDRNWDFEGELNGGSIRGQMVMRDPSGAVEGTRDMVWERE